MGRTDGHITSRRLRHQATISIPFPSIGLIVAGDVVYNQCRMYVGDTTPESRKNWIAALDRLAALNPTTVVAGHKKPGAPDSVGHLADHRSVVRKESDAQLSASRPTTSARCQSPQLLDVLFFHGHRLSF
jgi:hypothetical protein